MEINIGVPDDRLRDCRDPPLQAGLTISPPFHSTFLDLHNAFTLAIPFRCVYFVELRGPDCDHEPRIGA